MFALQQMEGERVNSLAAFQCCGQCKTVTAAAKKWRSSTRRSSTTYCSRAGPRPCSRSPPTPTSRRTNRFLCRAAQLESELVVPSSSPLCDSRRRSFPPTTTAGSIPSIPSSCQWAYSVVSFVASSSPLSSDDFNRANSSSPVLFDHYKTRKPSPPSCALFRQPWIVYAKPPFRVAPMGESTKLPKLTASDWATTVFNLPC